ncbi:MAG: DNA polymerase III subunit epsilon [Proteobacteria bacterium]|nr:DNA polymerase III subunit epsilon [Pseudomonadota bacterium]MDA1332135.1 DNA polymerase III subunit epsilon [Pseudomonadota bacterium]
MRYVILDTETTGLSPANGHRIIEIAAIEVEGRNVTNNVFQVYVNPQRLVEPQAFQVHGLSDEFLADKPIFRTVVDDLLTFVKDSQVVIHNAPFDIEFLNMELDKLGLGVFTKYCDGVIDSLVLARRLHPGRRNSLDALCERYSVDRSSRTFHGAVIDIRLLAEVYLAMTRGQDSLLSDDANEVQSVSLLDQGSEGLESHVFVIKASEEELRAHAKYLDKLEHTENIKPIWTTAPE